MKKIIVYFVEMEWAGEWNGEWNNEMWKKIDKELETGEKFKNFKEESGFDGDGWNVFASDEVVVLVCNENEVGRCVGEFMSMCD
jgi:hypothetical protein